MFQILKNNLTDNNYDNHIYFGLSKDEIKELKKLLGNDYGFLDIVIDFNDINKLDNLISSIPENLNKQIIQKYIYEHYLYYKMLSVIEEDIELKNILFGDKIEDFRDYDFMMFSIVLRKLQSFSKNKRIRLHLFLDGVNNKILQQCINDLIYARQPIVIMGYTTSEKLMTYLNNDGSFIETPHDYSGFHTSEFYKKLQKKYSFE